jgi:RND family efflux transporter MFP subunit
MKRMNKRAYFFAAFSLLCSLHYFSAANAAEFDCMIEPRKVLELRSPIEGLIERVDVDRGDIVKKGQVLAVLDTSVDRVSAEIAQHRAKMEGALQAGRSRLDFAERKSGRVDELLSQNYISDELYDQAYAERELAAAELQDALDNRRLAELDYERQIAIIRLKTIVSPVNGVVTERILNPGELAEAGVGRKALLTLAEIEVLYVEVIMPARHYENVSVGTSATIFPEVPANSEYEANVKVVDRVMDAASGTFVVRLEIDNPDYTQPAGTRCRARFSSIEGPVAATGQDF